MCCDFFMNVPALVMCPCRRGATSLASQILEIFFKKKTDNAVAFVKHKTVRTDGPLNKGAPESL